MRQKRLRDPSCNASSQLERPGGTRQRERRHLLPSISTRVSMRFRASADACLIYPVASSTSMARRLWRVMRSSVPMPWYPHPPGCTIRSRRMTGLWWKGSFSLIFPLLMIFPLHSTQSGWRTFQSLFPSVRKSLQQFRKEYLPQEPTAMSVCLCPESD